jgi:hypothetical protein
LSERSVSNVRLDNSRTGTIFSGDIELILEKKFDGMRELNCDYKSSTTCDFLNIHLNSRPSKISEKVFGWARFFDMPFSFIQFRTAIGASVSRPGPASRHQLLNTLFPKPSSLCCRCPDVQTMVGRNVARGCLSECSTRELWAT